MMDRVIEACTQATRAATPRADSSPLHFPSIYVAPTGQCYHVDARCDGLRKARSVSETTQPGARRPCKVCCLKQT
jgi:hypothetical protein